MQPNIYDMIICTLFSVAVMAIAIGIIRFYKGDEHHAGVERNRRNL